MEGLVLDFQEDGVHHDEEADGDGDGDTDELPALEGRGDVGNEVAQEDADYDGEEDPEHQEAVEPGEAAVDVGVGAVGCAGGWLGCAGGVVVVGGRGCHVFGV